MRLFELNNHSKLILSILLACPFVIAADTADQVAKQIDRDINLVRLTEKQKEDKANKIVVKAKDFFVNGQYKQAIDNYLSAIEIFKKMVLAKLAHLISKSSIVRNKYISAIITGLWILLLR